MNAPVSPTATAVRTKFSPGPETGGSAGGSPFASALDDALSTDRPRAGSAASDRGIERREAGYERAAERAGAKDARAPHRASDKAVRSAERPTAHDDRAPDTDDAAGETAEAAGGTTAATTTDDEAAADSPAAEPAASGLPGAIWALLMGTAAPSAGEPTAAPVTAVATAVPGASAPAGMPLGSISLSGLPTAGEPVPAPPAPPAAPEATVTAVPSADAAVHPATPPTGQGTTPAPAAAAVAGLSVEIAPAPQQAATVTAAPAAAAAVLPEAAVPPTVAAAAPAPVDGTAAPATAADATPAVAPLPVAGAGTSGGGTATSGGGTRQDARNGETLAAPVGVTTAAPAGAPAVPVAGTVDAASSPTAPAPPVGSQIARQVAVLRGGPDGAQTMTLVLSPENLGPVEVSVTLSKGTVDLTLRGAHDMGRAALLDGLPDLRRDLESAGLTCSRLEVDRDTGGSWLARHSAQQGQQGQPDRGGQQTAGENRSRPRGAPADSPVSGTTSTSHRSTSSGVDYRV